MKKYGAAHRNLKDIAVRCAFENANSIFSTNIIATLSLSVFVIWQVKNIQKYG